MPFDVDAFLKAATTGRLQSRTDVVLVPQMAAFFGKGEKPEWHVKALNGEDKAKCNAAGAMMEFVQEVIPRIVSGDKKEMADGLLELMGMSDKMSPDERIKRAKLLYGTVEPELDEQKAALLFKWYPEQCEKIVNKIDRISGEGPLLGESKRSGKTPKSATG